MAFLTFVDGSANLPKELLEGINVLPCDYLVNGESKTYTGDLESFDAHAYYEGYIEYSQGSSAVTIWLSDNVKKLTADNVIEYILNHQDEYNELS